MAQYATGKLALTTAYSADQSISVGVRRVVVSLDDKAIAYTVQIRGAGGTIVVGDPEVQVSAGASWEFDFSGPLSNGAGASWRIKSASGTPNATIETVG
jgi:hypothetical protein